MKLNKRKKVKSVSKTANSSKNQLNLYTTNKISINKTISREMNEIGHINTYLLAQIWWLMPVILGFYKLRQEDHQLKPSMNNVAS